MREETDGPAEVDPAFVARLSDDDQRYILTHEGEWESALAGANHAKADALEACADFNRRSAQAREVQP